jgi:hypothetical protein
VGTAQDDASTSTGPDVATLGAVFDGETGMADPALAPDVPVETTLHPATAKPPTTTTTTAAAARHRLISPA